MWHTSRRCEMLHNPHMDAAADTFSQFCGASARNPSDFTAKGWGMGGPLLSTPPHTHTHTCLPQRPRFRCALKASKQRFSTTQRIFFFLNLRGGGGGGGGAVWSLISLVASRRSRCVSLISAFEARRLIKHISGAAACREEQSRLEITQTAACSKSRHKKTTRASGVTDS